ncbi:MAG: hypothetical protein GX422_05690 [Deltaproteobacteria bacterium]|nr:hypothetical protein [Deltaproteobacteria bacterium]
MIWSGFAVLLIVPAAFVMVCVYVALERSGILSAFRQLAKRILPWITSILRD